jgi:hypothetical protein
VAEAFLTRDPKPEHLRDQERILRATEALKQAQQSETQGVAVLEKVVAALASPTVATETAPGETMTQLAMCGLDCRLCEAFQSGTCPGCHAVSGKPFWGECRLAQCVTDRSLPNCSACSDFPCALLYEFAYDKDEGDDGQRIRNLQRL